MMFYRVMTGKTVIGITYSKLKLNLRGFVQIPEEEFNELTMVFGNPAILDTPTAEEQLSRLQKETNLLKAQLKAQTESSTFLEDCIAEMALQVYK